MKKDEKRYLKWSKNGPTWSENAIFRSFKHLFAFSMEYSKEHRKLAQKTMLMKILDLHLSWGQKI